MTRKAEFATPLIRTSVGISKVVGFWIAAAGALGFGRGLAAGEPWAASWSLLGLALGGYILAAPPARRRLGAGSDPTSSLASWQNQADERTTP